MIIVAASILAVLTVPLTGRSLAPLARLELRRVWLVWASIGTQLVITLVPSFPNTLGEVLHLATFAASGLFAWSNRHIPGTLVIAAGAALNLTAIAANGGTMPASAWAWRTAGFDTLTGGFENSNVVHTARLQFLGDVFAIPHGWPLANVFSVGDVIIVIGVAVFVHRACRVRRTATASAATAPSAAAATDPTPALQ